MSKVALITGITGQDGSYLAEFLLHKGYEVHGLIRRSSSINTQRLDTIYADPHIASTRLFLHYGDLTAATELSRLFDKVRPCEVYNLGAQSHVRVSFDTPVHTGDVTGLGLIRIAETIRSLKLDCKLYQAGCHDVLTTVVTPSGFKNVSEIRNGDLVLTINESTGVLESKPVTRVIQSKFTGQMVVLKGRRIDQMLTPNHRVVLKNDAGKFVRVSASDIHGLFPYRRSSHVSLPIPKAADGRSTDKFFSISSVVDTKYSANNRFSNLVDRVDAESLFYVIGCYIGDGHMSVDRKELTTGGKQGEGQRLDNGQFSAPRTDFVEQRTREGCCITFSVPKGDKARKRLVDSLKKLNLKFTDGEWVTLTSLPLARLLKLCGKYAKNKVIPDFALKSGYLKALFDGLIDSDGNYRCLKSGGNRYGFSTVSKVLAAQFSWLCFSIGYYPSFSVVHAKTSYIKGRKVTCEIAYAFNVSTKPTNKVYREHVGSSSYSGDVWCLEVQDNHNFMVERNGKLAFSGNSSEMFGGIQGEVFLNEETPFHPRSPYGCAKVYAHWSAVNYREAYGMFISNGILFNHESPRRGFTFVTRKISRYVAALANGTTNEKLYMGNLDAKRDWGYSPWYVVAMWKMLQQDKPDDYVIATGKTHSVREFLVKAFESIGKDWEHFVEIDQRYFRPSEVHHLLGDASKAKAILDWEARTTFDELVRLMVEADRTGQETGLDEIWESA